MHGAGRGYLQAAEGLCSLACGQAQEGEGRQEKGTTPEILLSLSLSLSLSPHTTRSAHPVGRCVRPRKEPPPKKRVKMGSVRALLGPRQRLGNNCVFQTFECEQKFANAEALFSWGTVAGTVAVHVHRTRCIWVRGARCDFALTENVTSSRTSSTRISASRADLFGCLDQPARGRRRQ